MENKKDPNRGMIEWLKTQIKARDEAIRRLADDLSRTQLSLREEKKLTEQLNYENDQLYRAFKKQARHEEGKLVAERILSGSAKKDLPLHR